MKWEFDCPNCDHKEVIDFPFGDDVECSACHAVFTTDSDLNVSDEGDYWYVWVTGEVKKEHTHDPNPNVSDASDHEPGRTQEPVSGE